jgi:hypothetical protein
MTSDVKDGEQLFYVRLSVFSLLSIGRAGASQTRRLLTRISVDWVPPSVPPSGACLMLGTSLPCGLLTPPRGTPHRGGGSANGREKLGALWLPPAAVFRLAVAQPGAGPWPTYRHASPGRWRPRLDGPLCLWPGAGASVCSASPGPASSWPGSRWGALPGAVGGADGLGPETERPRPLRLRPDAPGSGQLWSYGPAAAAPHWHMLRA